MSLIDPEKTQISSVAEIGRTTIAHTALIIKNEDSSLNGDDALKLAGARATQYDEKYYARLRRKIVSFPLFNCL
jgi:hypothetical protein